MSPGLQQAISELLGYPVGPARPVSGGDINQAWLLESGSDRPPLFCKANTHAQAAAMFAAEADGLQRLGQAMRVPAVAGRGNWPQGAFLLLEYLESGRPEGPAFWEEFGRGLAGLHQLSHSAFGLDQDNFIATLPQDNSPRDNWPEFYADNRLLPQLARAVDAGLLGRQDTAAAERLCRRLDEIYPAEPPSLLHGDLWSGNFLAGPGQVPVLIDPAVYYGHRELDLAMMHLFGGFPPTLFHSYEEATPLHPGWRERLDTGKLYYLLVHVNLFGGSYVNSVRSILQPFG